MVLKWCGDRPARVDCRKRQGAAEFELALRGVVYLGCWRSRLENTISSSPISQLACLVVALPSRPSPPPLPPSSVSFTTLNVAHHILDIAQDARCTEATSFLLDAGPCIPPNARSSPFSTSGDPSNAHTWPAFYL